MVSDHAYVSNRNACSDDTRGGYWATNAKCGEGVFSEYPGAEEDLIWGRRGKRSHVIFT